jgi:hypothetical protein
VSGWATEWSWGAALAAASMVSGLITLWKILDALKDIQRVLCKIGDGIGHPGTSEQPLVQQLDQLNGKITWIKYAVERIHPGDVS